MFRLLVALLSFVVRAISAISRSRGDLVIENLVLRQQVAALKKERPRPEPELEDGDRAFWVAVRGAWPKWINALVPRCINNYQYIQALSTLP